MQPSKGDPTASRSDVPDEDTSDAPAPDLAIDTAVRPITGTRGLYGALLPDSWNFLSPSGGVLMTVALRAMRDEVADAGLRLLSATTLFCSRVPSGPLEVQVDVLRRGSAAAQVRAALRSAGPAGEGEDVGLEVSATFVRERPGPDVIDTTMPQVPLPTDAPVFKEAHERGRPTRFPFMACFDDRLAIGHRWWSDDWQPGPARFARWFRYRKAQRLPDGALDPLAIPPIADTMPPALNMRLGPKARFHAPSLDLTVHFLEDTTSEWLLVSAHCRRARGGYATADAEIWSEDGRLVAYTTQTMMIRKPPADFASPTR